MPYELESMNLPRLGGRPLLLTARSVESGAGERFLVPKLLRQGGIPKLRARRLAERPTMFPTAPAPDSPPAPLGPDDLEALARPTGDHPATIGDYADAYRRGATTPEHVARRFLDAQRASDVLAPPLRAFIAVDSSDLLTQARASARRHAAGVPLGPLDGVPIAVKDEVDQIPYPTTAGTRFLGRRPARGDATVVARLRAAGALLVGKTNMYEIGISPNGLNVHHGACRNPFDPARDPGGSSSGSAAAVAAGLCPAAIGADGGGSIRIPAAHCGAIGLKPTFGRVSEHGAVPLCWSVGHLGPIATTVSDAALLYATIAGPDPLDPLTAGQPPASLECWSREGLDGLRIGVYRPWFEHAEPDVVRACRDALSLLESRGARKVEVEIPELDEMRIAHAVTILAEMAASMADHPNHLRDFAPAVRINLALGRAFSSHDYLQAQRMRTRAIGIFARVFEEVDVIVTPTTAITAPKIPRRPLPYGHSDLGTVIELMRFAFPGNLTGLPAVSFPVGYDSAGLPIGMQAMAPAWREERLLRVAHAAEKDLPRRLPPIHYTLLD